jgi:hypothetical protein
MPFEFVGVILFLVSCGPVDEDRRGVHSSECRQEVHEDLVAANRGDVQRHQGLKAQGSVMKACLDDPGDACPGEVRCIANNLALKT